MPRFTPRPRPLRPALAALGALALPLALAACEGADVEINGQKGVPLSEIELAGPPPGEVALASGDMVVISPGERLAISVEGAGTEGLRFVRDDKVIGISRAEGWNEGGKATIRITMPPPRTLVVAGSGTIKTATLAPSAEVSIGGSGMIEFGTVAADKLGINIGGAGTVRGAGSARRLEINIGGSGDVELAGLKADSAEVTIGGSGDVAFASDGKVEANIAGSGDVKVTGAAQCTAETFGSGTLTCTGALGGAAPAPAALPAPAPKAGQ